MTLYNRGFSYYAVHSLSKAETLREGRKQIWISLHTKDRGLAEQRYFVVMSELMKRLHFKDETMTTPFQTGHDQCRFGRNPSLISVSLVFDKK